MPRKALRPGEHFSALREQWTRQVPPNASDDQFVQASASTPRAAPGHRGLSLQRQERPEANTRAPRLARMAMCHPAPHPVPLAPQRGPVNIATSAPSSPAVPLAADTVGRPEGFRLGQHFEEHTKKLRVSQWAEATVVCVNDAR